VTSLHPRESRRLSTSFGLFVCSLKGNSPLNGRQTILPPVMHAYKCLPLQIYNDKLTLKKNSRLIIFLSLCLTHRPVGESGQPVRVISQYEDTEASRVKARRSALLDSSGSYGQRAPSSSMTLAYSIKNAFISTVSNISSGKSVSFYTITKTQLNSVAVDR